MVQKLDHIASILIRRCGTRVERCRLSTSGDLTNYLNRNINLINMQKIIKRLKSCCQESKT